MCRASNAIPDEEAVGELESFSVASLPGFPHPTKVRDGELVVETSARGGIHQIQMILRHNVRHQIDR